MRWSAYGGRFPGSDWFSGPHPLDLKSKSGCRRKRSPGNRETRPGPIMWRDAHIPRVSRCAYSGKTPGNCTENPPSSPPCRDWPDCLAVGGVRSEPVSLECCETSREKSYETSTQLKSVEAKVRSALHCVRARITGLGPSQERALALGPGKVLLDRANESRRSIGDDQQRILESAAFEVLEEGGAARRVFLRSRAEMQEDLLPFVGDAPGT